MEISDLKPLKRNPRTITESALLKLQESISRDPEYMIARPIIADAKGTILGGNQRYQACINLGLVEIPEAWVRCVDWDKEKARRFSLVDNAPAGMSGDWDLDILKLDYSTVELEGLGFELEMELLKPPTDDRTGSSPWERVGGASEGVMFQCGEIQERLNNNLYSKLVGEIRKYESVAAWLGTL